MSERKPRYKLTGRVFVAEDCGTQGCQFLWAKDIYNGDIISVPVFVIRNDAWELKRIA